LRPLPTSVREDYDRQCVDITASATTSLSPEQVIRAAADFMTGKARLCVPSPVKGKEPREGPSLMLVWQPTPPAFAAPKTLWAGEVTPIVDTQPRSSCRHRSNCAELLRGA
jgi:hypothetical protein